MNGKIIHRKAYEYRITRCFEVSWLCVIVSELFLFCSCHSFIHASLCVAIPAAGVKCLCFRESSKASQTVSLANMKARLRDIVLPWIATLTRLLQSQEHSLHVGLTFPRAREQSYFRVCSRTSEWWRCDISNKQSAHCRVSRASCRTSKRGADSEITGLMTDSSSVCVCQLWMCISVIDQLCLFHKEKVTSLVNM